MKSHASMNRIYRLVWNAALRLWVAVAENTKGQGKSGSARNKAALLMLVPLSALMHQARAADAANASVVSGAGTVATSGLTTTVNQATQKLAIDWTSLSTSANEALKFNQPNASAIALNRITGSSPSELLGSLTANGQVFILNPNGVLFGAGSQVNVGGLVASTMSLSNADFEAGNYKFSGSGGGSVVNQGTLNAGQGGYLALLAPEVRNEGVMTASLGTALLAAGNKVTLNLDNGSLLGYSIDQGAINALAENKQLIRADGGQVLLSAKAMNSLTTATVNNTGVIEAKTIQNKTGRIMLMGDMEHGTVNVGGTLDASAPNGGDGGFIESSAANVKVAAGTRVTTKAANGNSGTWLIDPVDFTIAAGSAAQDVSGMGADTLSANLDNGNVSIATSADTAGNGDIFVNSAVRWSAGSVLTLTAHRNVSFNAAVTATGDNAGLALNYGGDYLVKAPITLSGGNASLAINGNAYTLIRSMAALDAIDSTGLSGNYALAQNLDAGGTIYTGALVDAFSGNFAGLGYSISNLSINAPGANNVGLFSTNSGSIRNLGLVGASVTGNDNVGALAGQNSGTMSGNYAGGDVHGDTYTGGLVGNFSGGTISNSYSTANVSGRALAGGLVGAGGGNITNSYSTGSVGSTGAGAGGLAGENTGFISGSYSTGNVTGGGDLTGGLVGANVGTISGSYSTGNVNSGTGGGTTGGLAGQNTGGINNSYSTSNVNGGNYNNNGGLVGTNTGTISNAYSTGSVIGYAYVGGLVGFNAGAISNAYSTGSVSTSGGGNVGGLVGYLVAGGSATHSFWNMQTSGNTTSAGGTGITTAQMLQAATFAGWDMASAGGSTAVWRIYEGNTGPLLRSLLTVYNLTPDYDGSGAALTNVGSYSSAGADPGKLLGTAAAIDNLTLSSNGAAGSYNATSSVSGLYSTQQGYDITATRTIAAPGSAAGDVNIANGINYTNGVLTINASGNINVNAPVTATGANAGLALNYGGDSLKAPIALSGNASLAINGNAYTLIRSMAALDAIDSTGLSGNYALAQNLDAGGTIYTGALVGAFSGNFAGLGYSISNLSINAPGANNVGLFSTNSGSIRNLGLVGASVTGNDNVGALAGQNSGTMSGNYAGGDVHGDTYTGGLVGNFSGGAISNSYSTANVSGRASVGGLVGAGGGNITNSYSTGSVGSTGAGAGGLAGENTGFISGSYSTGNVTGGGDLTGGLVGANVGTISGSYSTGNVNSGTGGGTTGGLAGQNTGGINNSYSTSNVNGGNYNNNGGLVGTNTGTISNAYSTGSVIGYAYVGGLVGFNAGAISNAYSTGSVSTSGGGNVGGLVGYLVAGGSATHSFWNMQTSGNATSAGGTGITTAQMLQAATFAGWDMASAGGSTAVWRIYEGNTGPLLRSFLTARTLADTVVTYNGTLQVTTASDVLGSVNGRNAGTYGNGGFYSTQNGYDLSGGSLTINKANLTLAAVADSKTYDGTTASSAAVGTTGLVGTDNLTALTQSFGSKNVLGTGASALSVDAGYVLNDGNSGGNYNVTVTVTAAAGTISKASLSVTGVVADNKTYNGTDAATLSNIGTLNGLVGGETLALSQTAATFSDKNAGTGKVVTASGYAIADGSGGTAGLAGNYQLASTAITASANIDKAALTVTANAVTRTYDGTTAATGAGTVGTLAGAGALETVNSAGSQAFADKNAGTGKTVTASGVTIRDAGNLDVTGNYDITYVADNTSVINKATLSVTSVVADNKTYNGTDLATLSNIGTLSGLMGGETLALSQTAAAFGDKNAGTGKVVTATGYAIADGSGGTAGLASNYQLASTTATASANIAQASLSITTTDVTRTYDGSTTAAGTVQTTGTVYGGDSVSGGSFAFSNKNAGAGDKVVNVSGVTVGDGVNNANYNITYVANTTSTIHKAGLTLAAVTDSKTYDGTTASTVAVNATGLVGGDSVAASQSFGRKNVMGNNASTLAVASYTITDGNGGGNYNVTMSTAAGTINKAALNIVATPDDKVYDGTTAARVGYMDNRIAGDVLAYSATASFATQNAGAGIAVNVGGITIGGADAGNYTVGSTTVSAAANINRASLAVVAGDATRMADGTAYTGGNGVSYVGLVGGDTAAVLGGTLSYGGSSQGASTAGIYAITPGGLVANGNYTLGFVSGALTLTPGGAESSALGGTELVGAYRGSLNTLGNSGLLPHVSVDDGKGNGGGDGAATALNAAAADAGGE